MILKYLGLYKNMSNIYGSLNSKIIKEQDGKNVLSFFLGVTTLLRFGKRQKTTEEEEEPESVWFEVEQSSFFTDQTLRLR